jgi:pyruvate dehydrogenase E2 component (dihydrolipoamide acetyltransferase)
MATPVIVPRESESMESCRIVEWHKKEGETVKQGEPLCTVETEKASFDIEAPSEGILLDIFFNNDSEAPFLTPIAVIGKQDEDYEYYKSQMYKKELNTTKKVEHEKPLKTAMHTEIEKRPLKKQENISISPRARRLAREKGVPLSEVKGTGHDGHIVERDIQNWISHRQ